jgi:uncharacterized protein YdeI (YjbR/CyaY-like superfamily)
MNNKAPEVDAYIVSAAEFARPILKRIRAAFHQGCPALEERLKWGVPSFEYKGMMGGMAAFKAHVSWGFWRQRELPDPHKILGREGMMGGGKITRLSELPPQRIIVEYVRAAARLNDAGPAKRNLKKSKPPVKVPDYFLRVLRRNRKALATFEAFSPSHKREYIEWITEAKQEATRERRMATAIEWLAQGKSHNWRYEKKCR